MKIIINKNNKKIFILDIVFILVFIILIALGVYIFQNPELKEMEYRDQERRYHIEVIYDKLMSNQTNDATILEDVSFCYEGFSDVDEKLFKKFSNSDDKLVVDPKSGSFYKICKNSDMTRIILLSQDSEIEKIEIIKEINNQTIDNTI